MTCRQGKRPLRTFWGITLLLLQLRVQTCQSFQHTFDIRPKIPAPHLHTLKDTLQQESSGTGPASEKIISNSRYVATRALLPSKRSDFSLDRLENDSMFSELSVRDRSFARMIVTTLERRKGQIDKVLQQCMNEKPKSKLSRADQYVTAVLQVGAAQLLFLETSPHAAVKETVDLLRLDPKYKINEKRIKFVNAVLRRISREKDELLSTTTIRDNAADWLLKEWDALWGVERTDRILVSAMEETPRCLTIKNGTHAESVAKEFEEAEVLPQNSVRVLTPPSGPVAEWPLFQDGVYWFQDVSATLPAILLQKVLENNGEPNKVVVDMCAAPGGKTSQLCSFGYDVIALEVSPRRIKRLAKNLERIGLDASSTIVTADATTWHPDNPVDAVLLDVPCSATGTASKRPDVLRRSSDLTELLDIQHRVLCHTIDNVVKVGGYIAYATCSLLASESEVQIQRILSRESDTEVRIVPISRDQFPWLDKAIDESGCIRMIPGILPDLGQYDGFFVAILERVK